MKKSVDSTTGAMPNPTLIKRVRHSDRHHTLTAKTLKLLLAASIIIISVLIVVLAVLGSRLSRGGGSEAARSEAAKLVTEGSVKTADYQSVDSDFGFSLKYDASILTIGAQLPPNANQGSASGTLYKDAEIWGKKRPYILVSASIKNQDDTQKNGRLAPTQPYLSIVANRNKSFWGTSESEPANKGKTKLDILSAFDTENHKNDKLYSYTLTDSKDMTIAGNHYRRMQFENKDTKYGLTTVHRQIEYATVQNDRPIRVYINDATNDNLSATVQLEGLVKNLSFSQPNSSLLVRAQDGAIVKLAASQSATPAPASLALPDGTANIPTALKPETVLNVVAKNQPSVVRIATIYCADVDLLMPDGSVGASLKQACNGGIGSGSFISKDGYIATNGHVARFEPTDAVSGYVIFPTDDKVFVAHAQAILLYLVQSGVMNVEDAKAFVAALQTNDPAALQKLNTIGSLIPKDRLKVQKENYNYAIQTSNDPLRISVGAEGDVSLKYTKTNLGATFVDADYANEHLPGTEQYDFATGTGTDVALLKAQGNFPNLTLGSIDGLKTGDLLTAIGYPAFVDGGLSTKQKITVPSVTQGLIVDIGQQSQANLHKLIATSVPIAAGNSGGPTLDGQGKQIGLNTYGGSNCADGKCFGNGVARDIADLKALLVKDNIQLGGDSDIAKTWHDGIDAFSRGEYGTAAKDFTAIEASYPANYLASKFATLASSKLGTPEDVSATQGNFNLVVLLVGTLAVAAVAGGVILTVFLLRGRHVPPPQAVGYGPPQGYDQYGRPLQQQQYIQAQPQAYTQQQQYAQPIPQQYPQPQYTAPPPQQQPVLQQQANPYAQAPTAQVASPPATQQQQYPQINPNQNWPQR